MGKLYPPTIGTFIPAFILDEEGTDILISVPFSMNRAVSASDIKGFSLKIKTAQSNKYISSPEYICGGANEVEQIITNKKVVFSVPNDGTIKVGQYLKFQLAYIENGEGKNIGYYSTVAIGKCTAAPEKIEIADIEVGSLTYKRFQKEYFGEYQPPSTDSSEHPYSFEFSLFDQDKRLIRTSGEIIHNSERDEEGVYIDRYSFDSLPAQDTLFYIQYKVKTINGLESESKMYPCIEFSTADGESGYIEAEANVDNGYIAVRFPPRVKSYVLTKDTTVQPGKTYYQKSFDKWTVFIPLSENSSAVGLYEEVYSGYQWNLSGPVDLWISRRAEGGVWELVKKARIPYRIVQQKGQGWEYKDFIVEQGITYEYQVQVIKANNTSDGTFISNKVVADFEDMFLYDGDRQLRIRFNPKMSSFKKNIQEQKLDTIGGKFPHFFRNGVIEYKEFPIGGLISYRVDENEFFLDWPKELGLLPAAAAERRGSPVALETTNSEGQTVITYNDLRWQESESTDLESINIKAERIFKMKVFDWLTNGKPKLFRSATEGNYIIRLMNTSLSPEDKLGRMLHSFSTTAYEINDYNYSSLLEEGLIQIEEKEPTFEQYEITSVQSGQNLNFKQIVDYVALGGNGSVEINELGEVYGSLFSTTDGSITNLQAAETKSDLNLIISYYYNEYYRNSNSSNNFSFVKDTLTQQQNNPYSLENKIIIKIQTPSQGTSLNDNFYLTITDKDNNIIADRITDLSNLSLVQLNNQGSIQVTDNTQEDNAVYINYIPKGA